MGAQIAGGYLPGTNGADVLGEVERFFTPRLDGGEALSADLGGAAEDSAQKAFIEAAGVCD